MENITIYKVVEVNKSRTEDKLDLQMLETKTLVLSCGLQTAVPFPAHGTVLTETQVLLKDSQLLDIINFILLSKLTRIESDFAHYFSDLTSFYDPYTESNVVKTTLLG